MKRLLSLTTALVFLIAMPITVMAMDHDKMDMDHSKMAMDHDKMDVDHDKMDMDHDKMDMDHGGMTHEGMMMLGEETEDGVKSMGHIKAYDSKARESMAQMGMSATHHFMVYFTDEKGKPFTEGMVAVKVEVDNQEGEPVKLMTMGDGFGGDISIPEGQEVKLKVGTKLVDGKKRQFEFELK